MIERIFLILGIKELRVSLITLFPLLKKNTRKMSEKLLAMTVAAAAPLMGGDTFLARTLPPG